MSVRSQFKLLLQFTGKLLHSTKL